MKRLSGILVIVLVAGCKAKQADAPVQAVPSGPGAGSTAVAPPTGPTESAVAREVNPPGDIPDSQAFVKFASPAGGYELDVPEGWARTENGPAVTFINKIDGVKVTVAQSAVAPTAASVRNKEAKQIQSLGHAVTIASVEDVTTPAGKAVLVKYTSNSDPNPVTNKQMRLEDEAYIYFRNGTVATLTLWAPQGADNADQWRRMSQSFRWR